MMGERKFKPENWRNLPRSIQPGQDPHPAPAGLRLLEENKTIALDKSVALSKAPEPGPRPFYRQLLGVFSAAE